MTRRTTPRLLEGSLSECHAQIEASRLICDVVSEAGKLGQILEFDVEKYSGVLFERIKIRFGRSKEELTIVLVDLGVAQL
jgi:hypothetical protein